MSAFLPTTCSSFAHFRHGQHRIRRLPRRPRRCIVLARASRLLVVELDELLKCSNAAVNQEFSERVVVDRKQSSDTVYVVYTSPLGYEQATKHIEDNKFVFPDALIAVNGSEIYQQQYRVPDPFWEQTVRSGWDPKPIKWTIAKFFEDDLKECRPELDHEFELHYEWVDDERDKTLLRSAVNSKLAEMGLTCRVRQSANPQFLTIVPASGSILESVEFCQKMLKIDPKSTFVYGCGPYVKSMTTNRSNWGIANSSFSDDFNDEASSKQVYLSESVGRQGRRTRVSLFCVAQGPQMF